MKAKVYERGTNKINEVRLVAVLDNVSSVKEDRYGCMVTYTNGEKDYHLKSQYKVVTE